MSQSQGGRTTRIYLLRHGATALNRLVPYRLQGRCSNPELDEAGVEQATRAAKALACIPLAAVYSSPLQRAVQTARYVALPRGLQVGVVPELIEADIGRWEGLTWDEVSTLERELYQRFMANPGTEPYPEGESFQDVQRRVSPVIAGLAAAHEGESIAVVGHNIVNRAYLAGVLGLPIDAARGIRQANGGINAIQYDQGIAVVISMNESLHLEGAREETG